MGVAIKKEGCPRCMESGRDNSKDNLAIYADNSSYCFSCGYTVLSDEEKERRGIGKFIWDALIEESYMAKEVITEEQIRQIKKHTGIRGKGSRDITDATYATYGVRFEYDEKTSDVTKHYYPVTEDYKASGYKLRV